MKAWDGLSLVNDRRYRDVRGLRAPGRVFVEPVRAEGPWGEHGGGGGGHAKSPVVRARCASRAPSRFNLL